MSIINTIICFNLIFAASAIKELYNFDFNNYGILEKENEVGRTNAIQIVSDPLDSNNKCVRFETLASDSTSGCGSCQRSELKIYRGVWHAELFSEYTYTFRMLIPGTWVFGGDRWMTLVQWHDIPDSSPSEPWRHPMVALMIINDKWKIIWRDDSRKTTPSSFEDQWCCDWQGQIDKPANGRWWEQTVSKNDMNRWIDFVFQIRWDYTDNGYIYVWKDKTKIVNFDGPVGFNDDESATSKFGIYRSEPYSGSPYYGDYYDRVMYLDDYVIYEGKYSPSVVTPTTSTTVPVKPPMEPASPVDHTGTDSHTSSTIGRTSSTIGRTSSTIGRTSSTIGRTSSTTGGTVEYTSTSTSINHDADPSTTSSEYGCTAESFSNSTSKHNFWKAYSVYIIVTTCVLPIIVVAIVIICKKKCCGQKEKEVVISNPIVGTTISNSQPDIMAKSHNVNRDWELYHTNAGIPYYYNTKLCVSSWTIPTQP